MGAEQSIYIDIVKIWVDETLNKFANTQQILLITLSKKGMKRGLDVISIPVLSYFKQICGGDNPNKSRLVSLFQLKHHLSDDDLDIIYVISRKLFIELKLMVTDFL